LLTILNPQSSILNPRSSVEGVLGYGDGRENRSWGFPGRRIIGKELSGLRGGASGGILAASCPSSRAKSVAEIGSLMCWGGRRAGSFKCVSLRRRESRSCGSEPFDAVEMSYNPGAGVRAERVVHDRLAFTEPLELSLSYDRFGIQQRDLVSDLSATGARRNEPDSVFALHAGHGCRQFVRGQDVDADRSENRRPLGQSYRQGLKSSFLGREGKYPVLRLRYRRLY